MALLNGPEYDLRKGKVSIVRFHGNSKTTGVQEYQHCNFILSGDYLVVISKEDLDINIVKHEIFPLNTITAYIRYM